MYSGLDGMVRGQIYLYSITGTRFESDFTTRRDTHTTCVRIRSIGNHCYDNVLVIASL